MHDDIPDPQLKSDGSRPSNEGGLHAPPGLGFWGTVWWWFHFVILVNLARFRFVAILLVIGLVILMWDNLIAYYDKWTRPAGQESAAHADTEYFCPMHPAVIRDHPKEKCPICFKQVCEECAIRSYGRCFCSKRCADTFFFGDDDE